LQTILNFNYMPTNRKSIGGTGLEQGGPDLGNDYSRSLPSQDIESSGGERGATAGHKTEKGQDTTAHKDSKDKKDNKDSKPPRRRHNNIL
jgi:hypothetical protein